VERGLDRLAEGLVDPLRDEAVETARGIWREINGKNLSENIEPTRSRASLLLRKGIDHRVTDVSLRRL
jgi:type I pantothenate kinase